MNRQNDEKLFQKAIFREQMFWRVFCCLHFIYVGYLFVDSELSSVAALTKISDCLKTSSLLVVVDILCIQALELDIEENIKRGINEATSYSS